MTAYTHSGQMDCEDFLLFNGDSKCAEKYREHLWKNHETPSVIRKDYKIITEMFNTEISYIIQLELLIKFFLRPLSNSEYLTKQSLESIFSNVLQLYNMNKQLLLTMRKDPNNISTAFITFAPYLKLYSVYACNYKRALEVVQDLQRGNKALNDFIRGQETRPEVKSSLISLLIAPIQRVPRYRLLLQSLLDASYHLQTYCHIQEALRRVEEAADHVNKLILEAEEEELVVQLARRLGENGSAYVIPGRKILRQGVVKKTSAGLGSSQRYLVLFNDSLLICKGGDKGALSAASLLPLRHVSVEPALGSAVFTISGRNIDMLVYTSTPDEGEAWIHDIQQAVAQHMKCRRTLRKDSSKRSVCEQQAVRRRVLRDSTSSLLQRARRALRSGARASRAGFKKINKLRGTRK